MPLLTTQSAKSYGLNRYISLAANSYESIATYNGTGSSSLITFSSIPQTYKHLQLRVFMNTSRTSGGATGSGDLRFNGDTVETNYYTHAIYSDYSGVATTFGANENDGMWWYGDATPTYVVAITDILDYTNTSKKTDARTVTGFDRNGSGYVGVTDVFWNNTAAVTSIICDAGFNWGANARFSLYGIKG